MIRFRIRIRAQVGTRVIDRVKFRDLFLVMLKVMDMDSGYRHRCEYGFFGYDCS